jgi:photosystem II stability/assembly factor-like uncharacterized protein
LMRTTNGGQTWFDESFKYGYCSDLCFVDIINGWAVGDSGLICRTRDGGHTWEKQTSGTDLDLYSVFFIDSSTGWAVGRATWFNDPHNVILHTADGGGHWVTQYATEEGPFYSVYFTDANNGWVAGCYYLISPGLNGWILHTTDGGKTWQTNLIVNQTLLRDISFNNDQFGYATGWFGVVMNGGANWQKIVVDTSAYLFTACFVSQTRGWVGGDESLGNGLLYTTYDGGKNWRPDTVGISNILDNTYVRKIQFIDPFRGWAACYGYLLKYTLE